VILTPQPKSIIQNVVPPHENWVKIGWILGKIELEFGQDFIEK